MLKDTEISNKFKVPVRTLQDWKKSDNDNWRKKLYNYLKVDWLDIAAMLYVSERFEPEEYGEDGISFADIAVELNSIFGLIESSEIDTSESLHEIRNRINNLIEDGDYSLKEIRKIVSLYNLKQELKEVF